MDFKAYGIDVKFDDEALKEMAVRAYEEGTGARALVSVIEKALITLEKKLPSTDIKTLAVTKEVIEAPEQALEDIVSKANEEKWDKAFERLVTEEKASVRKYVRKNQTVLTQRYNLMVTRSRTKLIAEVYAKNVCDINGVMKKIRDSYDQIKETQAYFCSSHDLNVNLHEDAIDALIMDMHVAGKNAGDFYRKLTNEFQYGLKLIMDRTGKNDFLITKEGLKDPELFLDMLVKETCSDADGARDDADLNFSENTKKEEQ
jgi:hypothetical protein